MPTSSKDPALAGKDAGAPRGYWANCLAIVAALLASVLNGSAAFSIPAAEQLLPDDTLERKNLIYRAHLGILSEEILQGNGDAVCQLLSNARAHPHQKSIDDEHAKVHQSAGSLKVKMVPLPGSLVKSIFPPRR